LPSSSADATLELAPELSDLPNLASGNITKSGDWIFSGTAGSYTTISFIRWTREGDPGMP